MYIVYVVVVLPQRLGVAVAALVLHLAGSSEYAGSDEMAQDPQD